MPWKSRSNQASTHCWATIGPPVKRNFNALRWRADDGPLLVVFGDTLSPHQLFKKKRCQSWTPLTKLSASAHVNYLHVQVNRNYHFYVCLFFLAGPNVAQLEIFFS